MLSGHRILLLRGALGMMALLVAGSCALAQEGRKTISQPVPGYPSLARQMRIAGTVKIDVVIAPDGHIKETKVIGGHPVLVTSALETLKQWKYEPSSTQTTASLEFHFHP